MFSIVCSSICLVGLNSQPRVLSFLHQSRIEVVLSVCSDRNGFETHIKQYLFPKLFPIIDIVYQIVYSPFCSGVQILSSTKYPQSMANLSTQMMHPRFLSNAVDVFRADNDTEIELRRFLLFLYSNHLIDIKIVVN